jgi:hypothetical protein
MSKEISLDTRRCRCSMHYAVQFVRRFRVSLEYLHLRHSTDFVQSLHDGNVALWFRMIQQTARNLTFANELQRINCTVGLLGIFRRFLPQYNPWTGTDLPGCWDGFRVAVRDARFRMIQRPDATDGVERRLPYKATNVPVHTVAALRMAT